MNEEQIIDEFYMLLKKLEELHRLISALPAKKTSPDEKDNIRWYAHSYNATSDRKQVTDTL